MKEVSDNDSYYNFIKNHKDEHEEEKQIVANRAERFRLVFTHDLVDLTTGDKMRLDEPIVVNNYVIYGVSHNMSYVLNKMLDQLRDEFLKIISMEVENK